MKIFLLGDNTAQFWHRVYQPTKHCHFELCANNIQYCINSTIPTKYYIDHYDAFVFQRLPAKHNWSWFADIKRLGKKLIWSLDDDLWSIPDWNPASHTYNNVEAQDQINWLRDNADEVWVSTEELQKVVGRGCVLPNLIDTGLFPEVERFANNQIHLVWAGSAYHEPDLEIVAEVFERVLAEYDHVWALFAGSFPMSMSQWVRIPGSNHAMMVPLDKYDHRVGYVQPVTIEYFPKLLTDLNPDICVAAVTDETFSHSKSNIKVLEYSMTGAAVVASDLPPYRNTKAFLGNLYENICYLIEHDEERKDLGQRLKQETLDNWTWQNNREPWLQAFCEI